MPLSLVKKKESHKLSRMSETIVPGIVESRRKKFSENEKDSSIGDGLRLSDINPSPVNCCRQQQECDLAFMKNDLIIKGKTIEGLQIRLNLHQTLIADLYQEKEELLSDIKEVRDELNKLKHRECVLHSDTLASIWKPSTV